MRDLPSTTAWTLHEATSPKDEDSACAEPLNITNEYSSVLIDITARIMRSFTHIAPSLFEEMSAQTVDYMQK